MQTDTDNLNQDLNPARLPPLIHGPSPLAVEILDQIFSHLLYSFKDPGQRQEQCIVLENVCRTWYSVARQKRDFVVNGLEQGKALANELAESENRRDVVRLLYSHFPPQVAQAFGPQLTEAYATLLGIAQSSGARSVGVYDAVANCRELFHLSPNLRELALVVPFGTALKAISASSALDHLESFTLLGSGIGYAGPTIPILSFGQTLKALTDLPCLKSLDLQGLARHNSAGQHHELRFHHLTHLALRQTCAALLPALIHASRTTLTSLDLTSWTAWANQLTPIWTLSSTLRILKLGNLQLQNTTQDPFGADFLSNLSNMSQMVEFGIASVGGSFSICGVGLLQALGNLRNLRTVYLRFSRIFPDGQELLLHRGFEGWNYSKVVHVTLKVFRETYDNDMAETAKVDREKREQEVVLDVGRRNIHLQLPSG